MARSWCFTANNPALEPDQFANNVTNHSAFRYLVFQKEVGEGTSVPHYQGYVEFKRSMRFNTVKAFLHNSHLEARRGTRVQARAYAMKEDTRQSGPYEYGEWRTSGQGHRTDLKEVVTTMQSSTNIRQVVESHPTSSIRYSKGLQFAFQYLKLPSIRSVPTVILIYGPTGVGKTRTIMEKTDVFKKPGDSQWFDGYLDEKKLLIDDFSGKSSRTTLSFLLMILDRYPVRLPVKGSYVDLVSDEIYVTTNLHPRLWYDYTRREAQYKALARRFHQVWWFKSMTQKVIIENKSFWTDWAEGCDEETTFEINTNVVSFLFCDEELDDYDEDTQGDSDSSI